MSKPVLCFGLIQALVLFAVAPSVAAQDDGLDFEFVATSDFYSNTSGGADTGTRHIQNFDLTAALDTEQLFKKNLGQIFVYALYNDTTTFSDLVGDLQVASNIDADQGWRLYEAWWDLPVTDNLSVLTGLYDLNSEFDAIETAGYFNNSSHGIGADYAQTGENGPSIFPSTSLAMRLAWAPTESSVVRYALLDGVPGDPDDPDGFVSVELGDGDGLLHAAELENTFQSGIRAAIGFWHYTADFEKIPEAGVLDIAQGDGNQGAYLFADVPFVQSESGFWMSGFARIGIADENYNQLSQYLGFGTAAGGFFNSRPDDTIGLAVAIASNGDDYKESQAGMVDDEEIAIELTYHAQITENFRIQPDVQYIINPGTNPELDDAWIVGARFELAWGF